MSSSILVQGDDLDPSLQNLSLDDYSEDSESEPEAEVEVPQFDNDDMAALYTSLGTLEHQISSMRSHWKFFNFNSDECKALVPAISAFNDKLLEFKATPANESFHLFPRLPPEIQRAIWKMAMRHNSQVIPVGEVIMSDGYTKQTALVPHSAIRAVNSASRELVIKSGWQIQLHPSARGVHKVFFNPEADILWLIMRECTFVEAERLMSYSYFAADDYGFAGFERHIHQLWAAQHSNKENKIQPLIERIAVGWDSWKPLLTTNHGYPRKEGFLKCMRLLSELGVKEVFIVVEDNRAWCHSDAIFIPPKKPAEAYPEITKTDIFRGPGSSALDWTLLSRKVEKSLEDWEAKEREVDEIMKRERAKKPRTTGFDGKTYRYREVEYEGWNVPKFEFVDAVSRSWIRCS